MRFTSLTVLSGNIVGVGVIQFQCVLGLCLWAYQVQSAQLRLVASRCGPNSAYHPFCVHAQQVLQSFRYAQNLTLIFSPIGPILLEGPFPKPIPCGEFSVTAYPLVQSQKLVVIINIRAQFIIDTPGGPEVVDATAAPVYLAFSLASPEAGQWRVMAETTCDRCQAFEGSAAIRSGAEKRGRFASLSKLIGNHLHGSFLPERSKITAVQHPDPIDPNDRGIASGKVRSWWNRLRRVVQ